MQRVEPPNDVQAGFAEERDPAPTPQSVGARTWTGHGRGMAIGVPDPIDVHVGSRLRLARMATGLTQGKIGEALGISTQQVQKYEKGVNRLGASKLFRLAHLLDVSVGFFFRDMPAAVMGSQAGATRRQQNPAELPEGALDGRIGGTLGSEGGDREVLRLISAFLQIPDRRLRAEIVSFVNSVHRSLPKS